MITDQIRTAAKNLIINTLNSMLPDSLPEDAKAEIHVKNTNLATGIIDAIMTLLTNAEVSVDLKKENLTATIGGSNYYVQDTMPNALGTHQILSIINNSGGSSSGLKGRIQ